jgi:transcriptional regulator with XRE-family HTH domain
MSGVALDRIAERVRQARSRRRLTQAQLAEATGITDETIGRIERAACEPSLSSLVAIATALEVSLDALLGLTQQDFNNLQPARQPPTAMMRLARRLARLPPGAQRALLQLAKLVPEEPGTAPEDPASPPRTEVGLSPLGYSIYELLYREATRAAAPDDEESTRWLASLIEEALAPSGIARRSKSELQSSVRRQLQVLFDSQQSERLSQAILDLGPARRR